MGPGEFLMDESKVWPAILREDGRRVEIICSHGVGHPVEELSNRWDPSWMGVHGCDGCCTLAQFHLSVLAEQERRMNSCQEKRSGLR